jgi:hypothetical protein
VDTCIVFASFPYETVFVGQLLTDEGEHRLRRRGKETDKDREYKKKQTYGCVVMRTVNTCMVFYELDFIMQTNRLSQNDCINARTYRSLSNREFMLVGRFEGA